MEDLWADLRGAPAPHSGAYCGAPTRAGTPCRIDAATCGWHATGQRARAAHPSSYRPALRVVATGYSEREYTSKRLRHLNREMREEWDGGPDGDGGEPMPITGT
jgi:hypothetical protein